MFDFRTIRKARSMRRLAALALLPLIAAARRPPAKPKTPGPKIVAAPRPRSDWREIAAEDLLVFELQGGRKVVMQLAPDFAPVHVANIRALARGGWWDGAKIYRVQDNYVVQWGNNESEKPFPAGVVAKPPAEYARAVEGPRSSPRSVRPTPMRRAPDFAAAGRWRFTTRTGSGQSRPLLCDGRRRPRPVARHRHRRRALCGHRPCPAPPRPQYRAGRADRLRASSICRRCRAGPRRWASTRNARPTCRSSAPGWQPTCPPRSGPGSNISAAASFDAYLHATKKPAGRFLHSSRRGSRSLQRQRARQGRSGGLGGPGREPSRGCGAG